MKMQRWQSIAARVLLSVVLVSTAAMKIQFLLSPGETGAPEPELAWAATAAEIGIAVLLWTPLSSAATWATAMFAVGGTFAFPILDSRHPGGCGCLGHISLTASQHAALAVVVFSLAGILLFAGTKTKSSTA